MISDLPVVVDACVLVQAAVRDTLLRLFERRLFLARSTDEIIEEAVRTLRDKLGRTPEQTDHLVNELRNRRPLSNWCLLVPTCQTPVILSSLQPSRV